MHEIGAQLKYELDGIYFLNKVIVFYVNLVCYFDGIVIDLTFSDCALLSKEFESDSLMLNETRMSNKIIFMLRCYSMNRNSKSTKSKLMFNSTIFQKINQK